MGLLSGSTFRGIVGGIASAYVDRREEARISSIGTKKSYGFTRSTKNYKEKWIRS